MTDQELFQGRNSGKAADMMLKKTHFLGASLKTAIKLTLLLAAALLSPAKAISGVKYLTVNPNFDFCPEGTPLPCTSDAGTGESNKLYVFQSLQDDGSYKFDTMAGTAKDPDTLWVSFDLGTECKWFKTIKHLYIDNRVDLPERDGLFDAPSQVGDFYNPFNHGNAHEFPTQRVAVNIPFNDLFNNVHGPMLFFFDTEESIYEHGEDKVQTRIDDGWTEEEARGTPFDPQITHVFLSAHVVCEGGLFDRSKRVHRTAGFFIEYMPAPAQVKIPPLGQTDMPGSLYLPWVNDVTLIAIEPDTANGDDPCTIYLSGVIQTNGRMWVEYRFINPQAETTAKQTIYIDHTQTGMIGGPISVPPAPPIDDYTNPEGGDGAPDDLITEVPDGYSGTYILEITWPNYAADAVGFNVPYCPNDHVPPTRDDEDEPLVFTAGSTTPEDDPDDFAIGETPCETRDCP